MALALSMLLLGLASGVHCVGMCGGFAGAFAARRVTAIHRAGTPRWHRSLAFNAGRISTYTLMGAAAGLVGHQVTLALGAQTALYVAANLMLVAMGLYLAGVARWLSALERFGAPLWQRLQPFAAKAVSAKSAYVAGLFWGALPCGLVYGALAVAAFAGSAPGGAAAMAAYGLGTAPWLLGAGLAFRWLQKTGVRAAAGGVVLAFGVFGLAQAVAKTSSMAGGIRAWLCL